jgi:hypothetical protein
MTGAGAQSLSPADPAGGAELDTTAIAKIYDRQA